MYAKGKSSVPSDSQARENVFWDLYSAAPERREMCEHSSESKAFHDYSAATAQSPVIGSPPGEGMPIPPGFFQQFMSPRYPGGPRGSLKIPSQALSPGNQPLLSSGMDPSRQPGHPNMSGPMQRMTTRGMVPVGPQNYGGGMRPPLNALMGPGMPGINMGPAGGRHWPNLANASSIPYSSVSPGSYSGPPAGGGPPGTPIMPSPSESNNSGDNMYSIISSVPPNGNKASFPLGSGADGPMGSMAGMVPYHMNDSLCRTDITDTAQCRRSGDIESLPKSSPGNLSINNQHGTPRDDGDMGGNFLSAFQSENYSPNMTMTV
ncbi:single-stranded DNA-binding protein 2-like isoform X8 [Myxocyprinus asiaticus]|uniref:single-stranded DNA-binding protein 2-like isoform X8 n=1 Tax=Myxocyprinus asiaticus TaxID=70543 RepID=UPI002221B093|nr:single-stranded DNA-binding protein 2-like isoform X8 [Myxocyprinus asiaticus]